MAIVKRVSIENKQNLPPTHLCCILVLTLLHTLLQPNVYIIIVRTIIAVQSISNARDAQIRASLQARSVAGVSGRAPGRAAVVPVGYGLRGILGQGDEVVGETTDVVAEIEGRVGA